MAPSTASSSHQNVSLCLLSFLFTPLVPIGVFEYSE